MGTAEDLLRCGVPSLGYHFTNYSEDILAIFTQTLDRHLSQSCNCAT